MPSPPETGTNLRHSPLLIKRRNRPRVNSGRDRDRSMPSSRRSAVSCSTSSSGLAPCSADFKNPVSCFDNFLWERYNGDILGYETQLRCGKLELEAAKNALEKDELNLNDKIEQLIEFDIEKSTLLLKSLELKEDNLSLLNVNQVKEALNKVQILVLESFNKEIELDFYKDDSFKTNKLYLTAAPSRAVPAGSLSLRV